MVDEIKNSDVKSLTLGKRNTLKSDAFKGKAIQIKDIKDKELRQFFGVMYRKEGKTGKDIGNMFIDEKEFEKIFAELEKAAGNDRSLSKEEILDNHYAESKSDARKLFNSLKKLAKSAGDVVEKNDDGSAKSIKLNEYKKPKGEFDKQEGKVYAKDGKLLYQDKDIQFDGHPVTLRKYFKDGDEKQVDYEDMLVEGNVVSRTKTDENGNKVKIDITTGEQEITTPEGQTKTEKGAVTTVTNPDGTSVKTIDKGNGVTMTVATTVAENGEKTAVFDEGGQKHTVRYDKDGNTYVAVKTGESFYGTAARLGVSENIDPEKFAEFRKLNENLIHKFKTADGHVVEGFYAGAEVRYPGTLEYNANTADILDLKASEEEAKYRARRGKKAGGSGTVNTVTGQTAQPAAPTNVIPDKLDFSVGENIDKNNPNVKTFKADVADLKGKEAVGDAPDFELTQERLTVFKKPETEGDCKKEYEIEYKDGVRAKHTTFDANGKANQVDEYKDGVMAKSTIFMDEKTVNITEFDEKGQTVKDTLFDGNQKPQFVKEYKDGIIAKETTYNDGSKVKEAVYNGNQSTVTTFNANDPNKVDSVEKRDEDGEWYERTTYENGDITRPSQVERKNTDGTITKTKYENSAPKVVGEEIIDKNGNNVIKQQAKDLADDLYHEIDGFTSNKKVNELLNGVNETNIIETIIAYKEKSGKNLIKDAVTENNMTVNILGIGEEYVSINKLLIEPLINRAKASGKVDEQDIKALEAYLSSPTTIMARNIDTYIDKIVDQLK